MVHTAIVDLARDRLESPFQKDRASVSGVRDF